ncbi:hypothetical protein INS49_015472 [Diaporthe citri]|uniref:uncharacterized protein n=1 Tax=Diaporthe citri TaxID=83186 RepID=UPI001C81C6B6|nr:uncharacterized protein INS49_015472 [Diaporthe citri]KAG6356087.1 hypothetical protein INS49_015472 [Diaporthe citri]
MFRMAPPKKTCQQKLSSNPYKNNEVPDPNEEYYQAKTKLVSKESGNRVGVKAIARQLANAPSPRDTGKSGYPHKFYNEPGETQISQLVRTDSAPSSTTSLYEYPVFSDNQTCNYQKKPRENPGHIRGITNQNKRFKGVVAHHGEDGKPNRGDMHWVEKDMKKQ